MNNATHFNQWLEIDRSKFLHNVSCLKKLLGTEIAAVVKGNGYGHGMEEATSLFYEAGIRNYCTYHAHAALRMKKEYSDCRWIAMGPVRMDEINSYLEYEVELFVWDIKFLDQLIQISKTRKKRAKVHLELETGMYRTGISVDDALKNIEQWANSPHIEVVGVCTHFSGADEEDNLDRIDEQFKRWNTAREKLAPFLPKDVVWHGESSSASIYLKARAFTMARVGILMYGFFPSQWSKEKWPLPNDRPSPAIQLKARICGYNHLPKGKYTGYGATYRAPNDIKTAIIPVGYADGLSRNLSHKWAVKANNRIVTSLGRINMNMTVLDQGQQIIDEGEEVVVIDTQPPFDWYEASKLSGRFIYEILTCLPKDLPKVVK